MTYARRQTRPKPLKSELRMFPAPIAGWISNRSLALPEGAPGAAVLDNYVPRFGGVKLRRGKQRYATLENEATDVTALFSYRNGNNRRLFAANAEKIYDLSIVTNPTGGELVANNNDLIVTEEGDWFGWSSTLGLDVMTGFAGGDWSVVQFATTGGVFLIGVNGVDNGFIFDGTEFWPNSPGGVFSLSFDGGTGDFEEGETVTGGTSGATAVVIEVVGSDPGEGVLYLGDVDGEFEDDEDITGDMAGAAAVNGQQIFLSPGITFEDDLTLADMSFVWVYKNRLWFIQKDSLDAWYLNVDSIGGAATWFPLAGVFQLGGSLVFGSGWSLGTSEQGGLGEQIVFATTEGEVAVYQGLDPSEASTWSKVGVYRVGTPLGKRAFFRGGGDIAIATSVGLVPLSKAIELDVTSLNVATVSYNIADAWSEAISMRGIGNWQCELWPEQKLAIISPPDLIGASEPVLFVSNTETGAWCRFTGWHATCMEVFEGQLYFGSPNGRVFTANVSGLDDGETYTGTVIPLFEDLGTPASAKIGKIVRAVSRSNARVCAQCTVNFDYDETPPPSPDATSVGEGNVWGSGIWGQAVWGMETPSIINQHWQSAAGLGYTMAPVYQLTSGSIVPLDDELVRLEVSYSTATIVS